MDRHSDFLNRKNKQIKLPHQYQPRELIENRVRVLTINCYWEMVWDDQGKGTMKIIGQDVQQTKEEKSTFQGMLYYLHAPLLTVAYYRILRLHAIHCYTENMIICNHHQCTCVCVCVCVWCVEPLELSTFEGPAKRNQ